MKNLKKLIVIGLAGVMSFSAVHGWSIKKARNKIKEKAKAYTQDVNAALCDFDDKLDETGIKDKVKGYAHDINDAAHDFDDKLGEMGVKDEAKRWYKDGKEIASDAWDEFDESIKDFCNQDPESVSKIEALVAQVDAGSMTKEEFGITVHNLLQNNS